MISRPPIIGVSVGMTEKESYINFVPPPHDDTLDVLIEEWMMDPDVPRQIGQEATYYPFHSIAIGFEGVCPLRLVLATNVAADLLRLVGYAVNVCPEVVEITYAV